MAQTETFWAPGVLETGLDISCCMSGHLSLHDYRKFLSQADGIDMPTELRGRTLKRKPAAPDLNQTRIHHDFSFVSSPLSSAPSSPPPLSFCQSVLTFQSESDFSDPLTPLGRPYSRPASQPRRMEAFRNRLNRSHTQLHSPHRRSSSESAVHALHNAPKSIRLDGARFEILNPRMSIDLSEVVSSTQRSSGTTMDTLTRQLTVEGDSSSTPQGPKFPSPTPGLLESPDPFQALGSLRNIERPNSRSSAPSSQMKSDHSETKPRSLAQKVSRFFGGIEDRQGKAKRFFSRSRMSSEESRTVEDTTRSEVPTEVTSNFMFDGRESDNHVSGDPPDIGVSHEGPEEAHHWHVSVALPEHVADVQSNSTLDDSSLALYVAQSHKESPLSPSAVVEEEDITNTSLEPLLASEAEGDEYELPLPRERPMPPSPTYRSNRYYTIPSRLSQPIGDTDDVTYQEIIEFLRLSSDPHSEEESGDDYENNELSPAPNDRGNHDPSDHSSLQKSPERPVSIQTQGSQPLSFGPAESTRTSIRPYLPPAAAFMSEGRDDVSSLYSQRYGDIEPEVAQQEGVEGEHTNRDRGGMVQEQQGEQRASEELPHSPSNFESFPPFALFAGNRELSYNNAEEAIELHEVITDHQEHHDLVIATGAGTRAAQPHAEHYELAHFDTLSSLADTLDGNQGRVAAAVAALEDMPRVPRANTHLGLVHRDSLDSHRARNLSRGTLITALPHAGTNMNLTVNTEHASQQQQNRLQKKVPSSCCFS